jgi:beta-glucosidase-like glycosyl hydrolase
VVWVHRLRTSRREPKSVMLLLPILQQLAHSTSTLAYNAIADDKTFHETFLAPFYDAVHSDIGGAMCAMNMINSSYACENQDILAKYLKAELSFPGIVHPDAGAQHDRLESVNAGEDFGSRATLATLLSSARWQMVLSPKLA